MMHAIHLLELNLENKRYSLNVEKSLTDYDKRYRCKGNKNGIEKELEAEITSYQEALKVLKGVY